MKCSTFQNQMWQKLSEMSPTEAKELNEHLDQCSNCALLQQHIQALNQQIEFERSITPGKQFTSKVMKQIAIEKHPRISIWYGVAYKTLIAASIAAAIVIGAAVPILLNTSTSSDNSSSEDIAYLNDTSIEGMENWFAE